MSNSFTPCSPAGEATTDFVIFSPTGTTSGSLEEEREILSMPTPYREEAGVHNDFSERLILFDEESSELQSPLLERAETTSSLRQRQSPAQLNGLNFLNVVTYAAHLFVSWGIGIWGLGGILETRWEILARYETLVTPAHWAYYLWAPIVVFEGIFTVAQLLPYFRARPIIQDGTSFFFFYTFLIQTSWTICFSFQVFIGSFISVVAGLVSLLSLLSSQHKSLESVRVRNRLEYVLFRFPFYLHTGWMVLMTVDHMSLLLRRYGPDHEGLQVALDILALAILLVAATSALTLSNKVWWPEQDFVIPLAVIWSYVSTSYIPWTFVLVIPTHFLP